MMDALAHRFDVEIHTSDSNCMNSNKQGRGKFGKCE
jgi:hypothetical protein